MSKNQFKKITLPPPFNSRFAGEPWLKKWPCLLKYHTLTLDSPYTPFQDHLGEPVPEEIFFGTFIVQGNIIDAHTLTIRLDAIYSE